ncbi:beta-hexosaminidase subunit alpha-like protein [Dinothrombium tinctorium]|uniref:Beta-hexosaminidase n=1 Tax=Dinothrombium tinctorium TaxID=1965070 RepID=A0A3S3S403_9ACAR|nr:beta-hexosaminidase subunit alpha-like protein [Dinothrombium tinctorium]RWS10047.1 beta-hexosaminidase subunit alpha-like protein [Dinothrombium tinctorium]RWS10073.1 beta-hexosaminidase subunit alpha-like protein [Dinothrombium tinctorium]
MKYLKMLFKFSLYFAVAFLFHFSGVNSFITYIEPRHPLRGSRAKPGTPWPLPQRWIQSQKVLSLNSSNFRISSNLKDCDVLTAAIQRYEKFIFADVNGTQNPLLPTLLQVNVFVNETSCAYPQQGDDEYYLLEISSVKQGVIEARTVWGALRALETLSQLVYQNEKTRAYLVNETRIDDWPAYSYRGILIDTARHFIPVSTLKQNLDAMAFNKMNVFHWHLVDDQSFPFESKTFPNLSKYGAYSEKQVYSQTDVKSIIEYARLRGIRVLPEIDSPGHTKSFGKAYPELLTPCYGYNSSTPYVPKYPHFSEAETLNPIEENVYTFMSNLFQELKILFPEKYVHLGMDEVYYECWESNPNIQFFMKVNKMQNTSQLEQYYVGRMLQIMKNIGYKYMIWQDPIDNGVQAADDTIVQIWKDSRLDSKLGEWRESAEIIAKKGYRMVVSACWYLNYINYPYPGKDWENFYECNPRSFNGSNEEKQLVLGGEACLWTEFVDSTNLISRLWPRASAVAERLWTNPQTANLDDARFRLDQQRCRLFRRGIPAAPILNGFCEDYAI